jgi:hypothetical protein
MMKTKTGERTDDGGRKIIQLCLERFVYVSDLDDQASDLLTIPHSGFLTGVQRTGMTSRAA